MKIQLTIQEMTAIAIYIALLTISAFIKIPFFPTPLTLQPLIVILCGLFFKPKLAFLTIALYLFLGLLGFPVFAQGGGIGYILQPTFGYLIGFLLAATVISLLINHYPTTRGAFFYCFIGTLIIHAIGMLYLQFILTFIVKQPLSLSNLFLTFVLFLPKDIFSCIIALLLYFKTPLRHHKFFKQ